MASETLASKFPSLRAWLSALAAFALTVLAVLHAARPTASGAADAPADAFSEARALPLVRHLTEDIGLRVVGTEGSRRASEALVRRLREIPGLEVEVQEVSGGRVGWRALDYRVRNVLARLPGGSPEALLLSAHYDSPPESVGAADDAAGVAVMVEVARALAASGRLPRTVVFNFNEGEEEGLLGADGFMRHPWARDVRAFINLEAAGARGKALLFQVSEGDAVIARAYQRAFPQPWAMAVAQDLFQGGLVPSDTDFRVYQEHGLRGLDLAFYEDGYAYHSALDRLERLEPGGIQQLGEGVLALVRELARTPLRTGGDTSEPVVFYDVLGRWMVVHSRTAAVVLAAAVTLLALAVLGVGLRRGVLQGRRLLGGVGRGASMLVAGVAVPVLASLGLTLLGRTHGWYAHPWLAVVGFGALSLAGGVGAGALVSRGRGEPVEERATHGAAGAVVLWLVALWALSAAGLGSAYVALWMAAGAALVLVVRMFLPRVGVPVQWWLLVPSLCVLGQFVRCILVFFIPAAGRMSLGVSFEPVIAGVVGLGGAAALLLAAGPVEASGARKRVLGVVALVGVAGWAAMAVVPVYDAEHPKRIRAERKVGGEGQRWSLLDEDAPALEHALRGGGCSRVDAGWRGDEACESALERAPAVDAGMRVLSSEGEAGGLRTVSLELEARGAFAIDITVPSQSVVAWTSPLPRLFAPEDPYTVRVIAPPAEGWKTTLTLKGDGPVPVSIERRYLANGALQTKLEAMLQPWTTADLVVVETASASLP
ncbi:M28 family metallopeptidase [Pyxidicoccus sp. MSG2]|uniref:M28 family metallopeptidase n=1 Tax=Pyxidicoccus sp. MSG2 TaxID=2996790 RepID=UPI002270E7C0|nr:M28 family metallopeptidase [Pyxidicoccus sp. MSG2]MCY1021707.1 M28 family metallopeptidase [Pyxidicoccus sp. MSG2]